MAGKQQPNNSKFQPNNLFNVKNKVVLITGGRSGIGLMATQALAVNGAKVYITGRTQEKLDTVARIYNENIPGQIIPLRADVTDKESIDELSQEISSREGYLSVLINNTGISTGTQETEYEDADHLRKSLFENEAANIGAWDETFRTNISQLFLMTTAFLPLLQKESEQEHGWSSTVLNITSISGIVKVSQHHFAYNASKAAAIHLTKMLAHETMTSDLRIRVNNIAPGVFPSEMTAGRSDENQKSHIEKERYEKKVPAARPGKDEDMASAILFAVANQYLSGQTVAVDSGYILAAGSL
ncbi:Short-chain dehydrogenase/reductase SDR [Penicillium malachiteum]|nr:Short-chain dehydrogenase/reductase SDR [Penicillium malachiteum]